MIALTVATPAQAASEPPATGGTLYLHGGAYAWMENGQPIGQLSINGMNWNGSDATATYPAGSAIMTITLSSPIARVQEALNHWSANYEPGGDVVVFTNLVDLVKDEYLSQGNHIEIFGAFSRGEPFTVSVSPEGLNVAGEIDRGHHQFS